MVNVNPQERQQIVDNLAVDSEHAKPINGREKISTDDCSFVSSQSLETAAPYVDLFYKITTVSKFIAPKRNRNENCITSFTFHSGE